MATIKKPREKAAPRGRAFPKGGPGGPGRPKGVPNKATAEIKDLARRLVEDADYRDGFQQRLHDGKLAPALESMLWFYAYGKPKETHDVAVDAVLKWSS